MSLNPGSAFAGYRVVRSLGKGGMGEVYLVQHPHLGRLEALKLISIGQSGPEFEQRFIREARTAAALKHQGIVTIYHYGVETGASGATGNAGASGATGNTGPSTPWFTMDYVEGTDLASRTDLSPDELVEVISRAADALDYAHKRDVVHRDVKPANLMFTRDDETGALDRVVLLDFGIARIISDSRLTATSAFIGTILYSAPEVLVGAPASGRSDQYSLAATAFELLTGRPPFAAEHPAALISAHLHTPPPRASQVAAGLAPVDEVLLRGLAKDPADRYGSCGEFARALRSALAGAAIGGRLPVAPVPAGSVDDAATNRTERPAPDAVTETVNRGSGAAVAAAAVAAATPERPEPPVSPGSPVPPEPPVSAQPAVSPAPQPLSAPPSQVPPAPGPSAAPQQERKRRGKGLLLALAALVVVAALAAVLALTVFKSDDDDGGGGEGTEVAGPSGIDRSTVPAGTVMPLVQIGADGVPVAHSPSKGLRANGSGEAVCGPKTIAWLGPLSRERAERAGGSRNGVAMAVREHNGNNPDCQVTVREFDTEGSPEKARQLAATITADSSVIGVVGPWTSGEVRAAGPVLNKAGLTFTSPSATDPTMGRSLGWKTFFRGTVNDRQVGASIANYLTGERGLSNICVIGNDASDARDLAPTVVATLKSATAPGCTLTVTRGARDFGEQVATVQQVGADAVFYAGEWMEAAPLVRQLRAAGVTVPFIAGADRVFSPQFASIAGTAASRSLLVCACGPTSSQFAADYRERYGQAPVTFAAEAYDLTAIMLKAIDSGVDSRTGMTAYFRDYRGSGMARTYQWDADGYLTTTLPWVYEVA